jgi:hypothetical protein
MGRSYALAGCRRDRTPDWTGDEGDADCLVATAAANLQMRRPDGRLGDDALAAASMFWASWVRPLGNRHFFYELIFFYQF